MPGISVCDSDLDKFILSIIQVSFGDKQEGNKYCGNPQSFLVEWNMGRLPF